MKTLFRSTILILMFFIPCSQGRSQTFSTSFSESPPTPDVLSPAPVIWWLGIEAGVNFNQHSGTFVTQDCRCTFSDGSGKGAILGAELSHKFSDEIGIAVKLLYDDKSASYTKDTLKLTLLQDYSKVPINYQRTLDTKLTYLTLNPMLELFPLWGFYLMLGPAISFRLGASYEMTEKILDDNYIYVDNSQNQISIENKTDIPNAQSIRLDIRVGAGYNLKLSRDVMFAPEISFGYPLTKISDKDNWLAQTLHVVGVLKFSL